MKVLGSITGLGSTKGLEFRVYGLGYDNLKLWAWGMITQFVGSKIHQSRYYLQS